MDNDAIQQRLVAAIRREQMGDLAGAEAICRELIAHDPDQLQALVLLGRAARKKGRYAEARKLLERARTVAPEFPFAHSELGYLAFAQDDPHGAAECFRAVVSMRPEMPDAHFNLAHAYEKTRSLDKAEAGYRKALALDIKRPAEVHARLGSVLIVNGRVEEGKAEFDAALAMEPDSVSAIFGQGLVSLAYGDFDAAQASFRQTIEADSDFVDAYQHLAGSKRFETRDDPDFKIMESLLSGPDRPAISREKLSFALAKACDDLGMHDEAFAHYEMANGLKRERVRAFDRDGHAGHVDEIMSAFTSDRIESPGFEASDSELPLLIVGMPRSGTTLVEQILSSHPDVAGAGEQAYFAAAASPLFKNLPDSVSALTQQEADSICSGYLDLLGAMAGGASRVTDKLPANFLNLGLIRMLFPKAKVVHCRRSPLDTCLSVYFQDFPVANIYANDLADVAAYYQQYQKLMAHWEQELPGGLLTVDYEDLVADVETQTRRMLDHLGLPWDEACLDFASNKRAVSTMSLWQVRQPIYTGSAGRWRNYLEHIGVLLEAFGEPDGV